MRNDSTLLKHSLTFLPPVAAGIGAGIVYAEFHPLTFESKSVFIALTGACLCGLLFAMRLVFDPRKNQSQSTWIMGLDVVVAPLASLEITIANLAIGWMPGTIFALFSFPAMHASTTRLLLPCIAAALAGLVLHLHLTPTQIQQIWNLADAKRGKPKLAAMLRRAHAKNDETTLHAIAKMPRMKPELLTSLAAHPNPMLRADVANNPNTPPGILQKLANDPAMEVRRAVAFNSAAGIDLLRVLLYDPDESIRDKAASRLKEMEAPA